MTIKDIAKNLNVSYSTVSLSLNNDPRVAEKTKKRVIEEAERLGFARMLGCMLCTSRAISAALPLAPLARFADLDGPTWLAVDVEPALHFSTGVLHL